MKLNHLNRLTFSVASYWSARRISILLTIVALVLWSYSITQAELVIGFYGLIHSLPVTFFIALGILTIASAILWVSKEKHDGLLLIHLCVLILSLWLIPFALGGEGASQPVLRDAYLTWYHSAYIGSHARINPLLYFYHSWPASSILTIAMSQISSLNDGYLVMAVAPTVVQFLLLPVLYVFFRETIGLNNNIHWFGLWLFYLGNWNFFGSQLNGAGVATYLLITFITIIILVHTRAGNPMPYSLLLLIIFPAIILSHPLVALLAFAPIMAALVLRLRGITLTFLVLSPFLLISWYIYGEANLFLSKNLPGVIEDLRTLLTLDLDVISRAGVDTIIRQVQVIRVLYSLYFFILTLFGVF
ncbi:hypothetical protein M1N82_01060 [Dehalococcoidia bacterium]|nr:hypothetical protein [Dehalococcoidia bacterium]